MAQSSFGARVRDLRMKKGLTQAALGQRVNVTGQTISNIERDRVTNPEWATIRALSEALEVDALDLIERIRTTKRKSPAA